MTDLERSTPPMPSGLEMALTIRDMGARGEVPVARITFVDVTGDTRVMDFSEDVLHDLVVDGAVALRQLHHGQRAMPDPWLH